MKKILINSGIVVGLLLGATPAFASTFTGTLSTGVTVSTGVQGIVIAAPTASPNAGVYTIAQSVSLSAAGSTSIHYTTDGSTPTCASGSTYSAVIAISASQVIQALSCYSNGVASAVASFPYAINPPSAPVQSGGGGSGGGSIASTPAPTGGPVLGDTNADKKVDVLDFNTVVVHWGETTTGGVGSGDLNGDGKVDVLDFNILIVNWSV